ncbi:MAG: LpxI family protein [Shimia sp.]|uniref:LpxI family protein n=1 Tax=Shimia sp. TaxID=1954381 RepID=UPI004058CC33
MSDLAILSGGGALPVMLSQAEPDAVRVVFEGVSHAMPEPVQLHSIAKMGGIWQALKDAGVTRVVFAGGLGRPALNPADMDAGMMSIAPRLMAAMQQGDDALLRLIVAVFEEQGFEVVGAHEVLPQICVPEGLFAGPEPDAALLKDAKKAQDILVALSPLDVGQGAVVAAGLCLGIETLQGSDALLRFVAETPPHLRRGKGVFVKMPKADQDLRMDMPAIGPDTVHSAAKAGLAGLVLAAHKVLMIDREATRQALEDSGLFLVGQVV